MGQGNGMDESTCTLWIDLLQSTVNNRTLTLLNDIQFPQEVVTMYQPTEIIQEVLALGNKKV